MVKMGHSGHFPTIAATQSALVEAGEEENGHSEAQNTFASPPECPIEVGVRQKGGLKRALGALRRPPTTSSARRKTCAG